MKIDTLRFGHLLRTIDPDLGSLGVRVDSIHRALSFLSGKEQQVLIARFGLSNKEPMTIKEVKFLLCTSAEEVRRIEARALRKLRHPSKKPLLTDPVSSRSCVKQMLTLEWTIQPKPLTWSEMGELAEKLRPFGWLSPTTNDLRVAIRDKVPGFTAFRNAEGFWSYSAGTGGQSEAYIVKPPGIIGLADKKSKQRACLMRILCKDGLAG